MYGATSSKYFSVSPISQNEVFLSYDLLEVSTKVEKKTLQMTFDHAANKSNNPSSSLYIASFVYENRCFFKTSELPGWKLEFNGLFNCPYLFCLDATTTSANQLLTSFTSSAVPGAKRGLSASGSADTSGTEDNESAGNDSAKRARTD